MTEAQRVALGELLKGGHADAAQAICEANGYVFVKDGGGHSIGTYVVRRKDKHAGRCEAMTALYEKLVAERADRPSRTTGKGKL